MTSIKVPFVILVRLLQSHPSCEVSTFNLHHTRGPGIVVIEELGHFLWNEANHLPQKSGAERLDGLLSNDTAVATDVDQGFVGDLVPGLLDGLSLEVESGAVEAVVVSLEGRYGAHIEGRDEKRRFRREEEDVEHPLARGEEEGLDIATDLGRRVRGESVHHEKRSLGDVLGDVVDVELHARDVNPLDGILAHLAPPPTRPGGGFVGVGDEEGWNVHTVSSDGECHGVSEPIAFLLHHCIPPEHESQCGEYEQRI